MKLTRQASFLKRAAYSTYLVHHPQPRSFPQRECIRPWRTFPLYRPGGKHRRYFECMYSYSRSSRIRNFICEVTVRKKCSEGGGVVFLPQPEAEFLDEIQSKALRIFLLAIQRHLHSFALRFIFLQTRATSYSFYSVLVYTVKETGGKPDKYPLPNCFRKSIQ